MTLGRTPSPSKPLAIACSLALISGGCFAGALVLHFWRPHYAGALTWAVGVAIFLGVLEVLIIGKLPERVSRLLRLDGMIFPFFSVGVGTAIVLLAP